MTNRRYPSRPEKPGMPPVCPAPPVCPRPPFDRPDGIRPPMFKTVDGVTYYRLKSGFEGDRTKNCGLTGEEVDQNFFFLRGYDIDSIRVDECMNLIIERVDKNYEPLVVNLAQEFEKMKFYLDKENGNIIIRYPDGTTDVMDGFLVEGKDVKVATDDTLDGDGTRYNPLRIADVERTGTFAPASEYVDLTYNDSTMPDPRSVGMGYRVVTKETIDNFGRLYSLSEVEAINRRLRETRSPWRVPTKQDWDELLNSLECSRDRDHDRVACTWLGKTAGSALKSVLLWDENMADCEVIPTEGRDVKGMTIYPLGISPDRNEILNEGTEGNHDIEGFGKMAGMWTSTETPEGNAYVKIFAYNHADVDQDTYGRGARMSLRLVKDYDLYNYSEMEEILGQPYPTELVYGIHRDYPYNKIWTKINVYSSDFGGVKSNQWSAVTDTIRQEEEVYYVNESNGFEWHKRMLREGDSVVINEYKNPDGREITENHEWRVIDGVLTDTLEALKKEFSEEFERIETDVAELSASTESFSAATVSLFECMNERIDKEIDRAMSAESILNAAIVAEADRAQSAETVLSGAIVAESERAMSAESALTEAIAAESNRAQSAETILAEAIEAEADRAQSAENDLLGYIASEADRAQKAESALTEAINAEAERAMAAETNLNEAINAEAERANQAEQNILNALKAEMDERSANDIVPGEYELKGAMPDEGGMASVLPTRGGHVDDVKISLSDDFFNFGTF